jgi:fluoride exporter
MIRTLAIIGLGGGLGSMARYLTGLLISKLVMSQFPIGTFVANVVGCLIIGVVFGLSARYGWFSPEWRLFLATGFCGGYTTFSTFSYENLHLLQTNQFGTFAVYALSSFALGMLAVWLGLSLVK